MQQGFQQQNFHPAIQLLELDFETVWLHFR